MTSTERPQDSDGDAERDAQRGGASRWLRRSPLVIASVAAAVLLAGGGGVYFATASSDGDDSGKVAGDTEQADSPGTVPGPGIAPGEPSPYGVEYYAAGKLPEVPDTAFVHRADGMVAAADVARLAKALGVAGEPERAGTAWKVGARKDGSGPLLSVERQRPGTWTFGRFGAAPGGDNCLKGKDCPSGGAGGAGDNPVVPDDGSGPVSEEAAKKAAAPVLKALGQQDAALDARQLMGAVRVVNAAPVIGGLPTYGWSSGIQIGADGQVVAGSGKLMKPVKGEEYPVGGAAEALKRLNESSIAPDTSGTGGCASAMPHQDGREPVAPCGPGAKGGEGGKGGEPAEPTRVPVKKAVFGLAAQQMNGALALVPAWWFEVAGDKGGPVPTVIRMAPPAEEAPARGQDGGKGSPIETYKADGSALSVRFVDGVCGEYSLRAKESGSTVTVEVVDSAPQGGVCVAMAQSFVEKVTLDRPLGDRKVVDALTGDAVPLQR